MDIKKLDSKRIQSKIKKMLGDSITIKDEIALSTLATYIEYHNKCVSDIEQKGMIITYYRSNGTSALKENPHVNILLRLSGSISKLLNELGMTPKSRSRMADSGEDEGESPLSKLMDKNKKG